MTDSIKNPSAYAIENILGPASTKTWTNPTNVYTENGVVAYTSLGRVANNFYAKLYDSTAYNGDLMYLAITLTTTLTWIADTTFTNISGITPALANATSFGFGFYYAYGTAPSKDLRTSQYGFSIPTDCTIIAVSFRVKHGQSGASYTAVDVAEMTVTYETASAESPSSNAYSSGPMMFKSPRDLLRFLKKPVYTQTSTPRRVSCFKRPSPI